MISTRFFSFISSLFLLAVFNKVTISQVNLQKIASYQYAQYDGTWYTVVDGKQGDLVDTKHIVVRLKDKSSIDQFDYAKLDLPHLKNVSRHPAIDGFYKLEIPKGIDGFKIIRKLEGTGKFEHIFFNIFMRTHAIPNDTQYGSQWHLSKISISSAWDVNRGNNTILVAIIDTGGDYDHEDLIGNQWSGIGDDLYGGDTDPYPDDGAEHGTAVAGICGAVTNNQIGVSGVAGGWNGVGGIRIMHFRAGGFGGIDAQDAVNSIYLAAQRGAKVINMSFGSLTHVPNMPQAISNAIDNYDVVCVASSGFYLSGQSTALHYPAAYSNVFAVGGTVQNDTRKEPTNGDLSGGSSYGPQLDVVAPGVSIITTDITGSAGEDPGNYTSLSGTSAAAPQVAGLAALIRSVNPALTAQQVQDIIRNSADKVSAMGGNNFTNEYGYGRINAYKALKYTLENHGGTLTQNLTIPSGETWTLAPGVTWNFASGTSLTINGSINATGTSTQRITFTGTSSTPGNWNGIKINSGIGSNVSTLRRCNVSYATTGVTVTYTGFVNSVTLDKCRISNNSSKGISVNGNGYSSASAHPTLSSNHIHNNSSSGITVSNYGKPLITGNQINYNSGYGIEATSSYTGTVSYNRVANNGSNGMIFYSSSHAQVHRNTVEANNSGGIYIFSNSNVTAAGGGTNQGRNEITSNTGTGVYANTSSPNFGISNGYNWMQSNTNYEAQMVGSSGYQLRAENCYWGGGAPPANEISGNVDYSPHVTTVPSPIGWGQSDGHDPSYLVQPQPNPIIAITPPQSFYPLMTSRATNGASGDWTRDLIDAINAGLATGDWSQASELITALHRELQDARVPAVEFALVTSYANRHDVASSIRKMLALVLVENELVENKESAALARLNAFRQSNREHAAEFWANTGLIHLYRQNDVAAARSVLAQLQTLAQNGDNIAAEHVVVFGRMIEDYEEDRAGADRELQKPLATQAHSLPSTPTLTQNYPNPFNPETSIRFHLNQSQNIRLAIYDVNGRHVRTLVAGEFSEGEHIVSWDGRDEHGRQAVSGVYFYELIAEDKVERKKMTVLR